MSIRFCCSLISQIEWYQYYGIFYLWTFGSVHSKTKTFADIFLLVYIYILNIYCWKPQLSSMTIMYLLFEPLFSDFDCDTYIDILVMILRSINGLMGEENNCLIGPNSLWPWWFISRYNRWYCWYVGYIGWWNRWSIF